MSKDVLSNKPKLVNGFGEVFDYKDTDLERLAIERIHQKRLNLEREISKFRVQKKLEKNNFFKFKNNAKIIFKSQKTEIKLKYKQSKKVLNENLKSCDTLIPLEKFINRKTKKLNSEIRAHIKKSMKSLNLIQYSDDEENELVNKTNDYKQQAIIVEDQLIALKQFLNDVLSFKPTFSFEEANSEKKLLITIEPIINKIENPDVAKYCETSFKKIIRAYKSQPYFKYHGQSLEIQNKLNLLTAEYKKDRCECSEKYKTSIKNEKWKIKNKYQESVKESKDKFEQQKLKIKDEHLKNEAKLLDEEIKERSKLRKAKIKEIKHQCKIEYRQEIKKYKSEHKSHFKFWSNKVDAVIESYNTLNFRLLFNPKLYSLNKWLYRNDLKRIKASYWNNMGEKLDNLTYESEYLIKNSYALQDYVVAKEENDKHLVEIVEKNQKLISPALKMDEKDKQIFNEKKTQLKNEFLKNVTELKQKLSNKEITKEAFRNKKLKLEIFLEEDIKALKMNLDSSKEKFASRDTLITYKKQNQLCKKNLLQDRNKISKETPIEYKRNNSIWMSMIAFFLPGVDSLILKNWKKSIFFLVATILVWSVFIPYCFGVYNIKGNGIIGLIQLSWPTGAESPVYGPVWSDSRYALVEGVISVLLLILCFSYLTISAYQCFKITRSMEKGIRYNTWVETKKILKSSGFPYAISIPGLILIIFIVIMPIIVSLLLAFTNIGTGHNPAGGNETNWVGFEQFIRLFTNEEFFKPFGNVLWWNIVWALSTTALVLFLGTVMALAIENRNIKAKALWRTIFILPWAIPAFLSILFFKIIFSDSSQGLINSILFPNNPISWQTDAIMSRVILILIQGWLGHSYIVLLVSGNMKAISGDIYEAARVDGATPFKQFMKMTLPIILLQIAPLLISQFTFNFNNFSIIWLFNDGGSKIDPSYVYDVGNTDIILSWIFKITFGSQASNVTSNQALGSALVIVMSIFVVGASGIGFARSKAFRKGVDI